MISILSKMNLQNKAVTLIAAILFLILGINTAVLTGIASRKYKSAMLAKSAAIGELMQKDLNKSVSLGIPIEALGGVSEKLAELVLRDRAMGYAMVMDLRGKVLYHTMPAETGKELKDDATAKVISSTLNLVKTWFLLL